MAGLVHGDSLTVFIILIGVITIAINGKPYFEYQVHTVGNCLTASLKFELLYTRRSAGLTLSFSRSLNETTYLNRVLQEPSNEFQFLSNITAELKWSSRAITEGTSCCWMVTDTRIVDNTTSENKVFPIQLCNHGNVQMHVCNGSLWACTLSNSEGGRDLTPTIEWVSDQYIFTSDNIDGIKVVNACQSINASHALYNSTPPDEFCPSLSALITPTTTTTISNTVSPITQTPIINGRVYCASDGIWTSTSVNTNITVQDACYGGTVEGTRRCSENGEWDDLYCIVSRDFIITLNMIRWNASVGLQRLSEDVAEADANNFTIEQFQFLLEAVVDSYQTQQFFVSITEEIKLFLQVSGDIAELIINNFGKDTMLINKERQIKQGARLLQLQDEYGQRVVQPLTTGTINFESISLRVLEFNDPTEGVIAIQDGNNFITIPLSAIYSTDTVRVVSLLYNDLSQLLPPSDPNSTIVSSIISATTNCTTCPIDNLDQNVTIQLQIEMLPLSNQKVSCAFFQFELDPEVVGGDWNTSGCTTSVNGDLVTCSCNHLTHFAILLSPGGPEISSTHYEILNTIGLVLVPISLLCMVLVILTYTLIRSLWNIRNYIHIMLCGSLFMAQLVFIIGVDKIENTGACSAVAVILLYLFLVTFMWMLMEGVVLYVTLVKVLITNHKYYMIAFTVASYGVPALYMTIVVPIGFLVHTDNIIDHTHFLYYRMEDGEELLTACWLNYSTGFIWSFIAPFIVIIMVNIGFFIMALIIAKKHSIQQQSKVGEVLHWLQASISLTIVMGIAWLVGLLAFWRELLPIIYITTIFIAAQGVIIFIVLVPLSKPVRKVFRSKFLKRDRLVQSVAFSKIATKQSRTFSVLTANSTVSLLTLTVPLIG